jgi:hypothetical protein
MDLVAAPYRVDEERLPRLELGFVDQGLESG